LPRSSFHRHLPEMSKKYSPPSLGFDFLTSISFGAPLSHTPSYTCHTVFSKTFSFARTQILQFTPPYPFFLVRLLCPKTSFYRIRTFFYFHSFISFPTSPLSEDPLAQSRLFFYSEASPEPFFLISQGSPTKRPFRNVLNGIQTAYAPNFLLPYNGKLAVTPESSPLR